MNEREDIGHDKGIMIIIHDTGVSPVRLRCGGFYRCCGSGPTQILAEDFVMNIWRVLKTFLLLEFELFLKWTENAAFRLKKI